MSPHFVQKNYDKNKSEIDKIGYLKREERVTG